MTNRDTRNSLATAFCGFSKFLRWRLSCALSRASRRPLSRRSSPPRTLCSNGDFAHTQEATARPLPQDWSVCGQGASRRVEMSDDAFRAKRSLRMAVAGADSVGINSVPIATGHGLVRFHYKVLKSTADGTNLAFGVIGLSGPAGAEVRRQVYTPPKEHIGDGKWHEAQFEFDFSPQHARHCLVAARINENTPSTGDGDWLLADVEVFAVRSGPQIKVAHVWSDKPLARTGDAIRFSAWIEASGDEDAREISAVLESSDGIQVEQPVQAVPLVADGSYCRLDWHLRAEKPASVSLKVVARLKGVEKDTAQYQTLVIDPKAQYTRQELCTDEHGYWQLLERPKTLQEDNAAALTPVVHKKSSEIKRNTYGVCTHLPRSKDYEDPFNPSHLIDDDPETCWSSQQNSSAFPGTPPWAEIDLGRDRHRDAGQPGALLEEHRFPAGIHHPHVVGWQDMAGGVFGQGLSVRVRRSETGRQDRPVSQAGRAPCRHVSCTSTSSGCRWRVDFSPRSARAIRPACPASRSSTGRGTTWL